MINEKDVKLQDVANELKNYAEIHNIPIITAEQMRVPTQRERDSVDRYIHSISKPTGICFYDYI